LHDGHAEHMQEAAEAVQQQASCRQKKIWIL